MNIAIDLGNTFIKAGIFKKNILSEKFSSKSENIDDLIEFIKKFNSINCIIISSVLKDDIFLKTALKSYNLVELNHTTNLPVKNKYFTPESLGTDRIALTVGGNAIFPNENLLIIGAGTCLTYDYINKYNEYEGGSISPGINLRLKSLHTMTGKLPLIEFKDTNLLIGRTTAESILTGVINGTIREIEGTIEQYRTYINDLKIIITGGEHNFIKDKLKIKIFAEPDLVLKGLNRIISYNMK